MAVSPPPLRRPLTDDRGIISAEWARWFSGLRRDAGSTSPETGREAVATDATLLGLGTSEDPLRVAKPLPPSILRDGLRVESDRWTAVASGLSDGDILIITVARDRPRSGSIVEDVRPPAGTTIYKFGTSTGYTRASGGVSQGWKIAPDYTCWIREAGDDLQARVRDIHSQALMWIWRV